MMGPSSYRRADVARIQERARSLAVARGRWPEEMLPMGDAASVVLMSLDAPPRSDWGSLTVATFPPGALRHALERLIEQGLVADHGGGLQPYRLTELGSAVLLVEAGVRMRQSAPSFADALRG